MTNKLFLFFAALLSLAAAARAAEVGFDGAGGAPGTYIDIMEISAGLAGVKAPPKPPVPSHQPPHQPPANGPKPLPGHPGVILPLPPPPPLPKPQAQYQFGGYRESCRTFSFTAQSPLILTEDLTLEEYGEECETLLPGHPAYCRPVSRYHKRKVTVNIGPRRLEPWETERLELCMRSPKNVEADTAGMLYQYEAASRNDDNFFKKSTFFTLTPGLKKPSRPASGELSIGYTGVSADGAVRMALADSRFAYFLEGQITIAAEVTRLPEIAVNPPAQDLPGDPARFSVTQTFVTASVYELKLMDAPRPGKYAVALRFTRSGPHSSGEEGGLDAGFELR
jgi:hypothetical protein